MNLHWQIAFKEAAMRCCSGFDKSISTNALNNLRNNQNRQDYYQPYRYQLFPGESRLSNTTERGSQNPQDALAQP
ncbi:MAG TPA: hypothetical protein VHT24_06465, partial [Pseudacidobacterium sp.]|nr:hypothetical protein [Pseudacidobacterium sp.]